jgi:hypothetical protein
MPTPLLYWPERLFPSLHCIYVSLGHNTTNGGVPRNRTRNGRVGTHYNEERAKVLYTIRRGGYI